MHAKCRFKYLSFEICVGTSTIKLQIECTCCKKIYMAMFCQFCLLIFSFNHVPHYFRHHFRCVDQIVNLHWPFQVARGKPCTLPAANMVRFPFQRKSWMLEKNRFCLHSFDSNLHFSSRLSSLQWQTSTSLRVVRSRCQYVFSGGSLIPSRVCYWSDQGWHRRAVAWSFEKSCVANYFCNGTHIPLMRLPSCHKQQQQQQ